MWSVPDNDPFEGDPEIIDERRIALADVLHAEGDRMTYEYDFGDGWRHDVVLEKIVASNSAATKPVCLAGERRCPPEDVGGPFGYHEFLEAIFDPGNEESDHLRNWAGGEFHAEEFDAAAVNVRLSRMRQAVKHPR